MAFVAGLFRELWKDARMDKMEESISSLRDVVEGAVESMGRIEGVVNRMEAAVGRVEALVAGYTSAINDIEKRLDGLEKRTAGLEDRLARHGLE